MSVNKIKLNQLRGSLKSSIDVFICSASFEARCLSVAKNLNRDAIKRVLVAENEDFHQYVGKNTKRLCQIFGSKATRVGLSTSKPLLTADRLKTKLDEIRQEGLKDCLIDITTLTHEALLILIQLLHSFSQENEVHRLIYANAAEYSVGYRDKNKWLSKGVCNIRSVLGYPGEVLPSRKDNLIILVGYEHQRASKLIESFEPDIISLGYGKPGSETSEKHREANLHFKNLVAQTAVTYGDVEEFEFSCNNPWEAKQAILECVQKTPGYNHIVAPMNTKISTIGSALAALFDETIQLCYAQPLLYNYRSYSSPGDTCYLLDFQDLLN